jgi:hypothetical protein
MVTSIMLVVKAHHADDILRVFLIIDNSFSTPFSVNLVSTGGGGIGGEPIVSTSGQAIEVMGAPIVQERLADHRLWSLPTSLVVWDLRVDMSAYAGSSADLELQAVIVSGWKVTSDTLTVIVS